MLTKEIVQQRKTKVTEMLAHAKAVSNSTMITLLTVELDRCNAYLEDKWLTQFELDLLERMSK